VPLGYLKELAAYWADGFDWRAQGGRPEAALRAGLDHRGAVHHQHVMADRDAAIARELNRLIEGT